MITATRTRICFGREASGCGASYPDPVQQAPRETGFSLLEVIVAMTIFSTAVLGIVTAFSQATRASGEARREVAAVRLAEAKLLESTRVERGAMTDAVGEDEAGAWSVVYQRRSDGLGRVDVTVEWGSTAGPEEVTLYELFPPIETASDSEGTGGG